MRLTPSGGVVTFTNGIEIHTGEVLGDVSEKDIRRVQIRETIRSHFEKERNCIPAASRPFPCSLSIRWRITESMMLMEMK